MIGYWIKRILANVRLAATYSEGDLLRIELYYKGQSVFDRTIDVIKNH